MGETDFELDLQEATLAKQMEELRQKRAAKREADRLQKANEAEKDLDAKHTGATGKVKVFRLEECTCRRMYDFLPAQGWWKTLLHLMKDFVTVIPKPRSTLLDNAAVQSASQHTLQAAKQSEEDLAAKQAEKDLVTIRAAGAGNKVLRAFSF